MLSLTQTLSFWNGEGDDDGDTYANNSYDNTSYSGSTYDSSSTYNDGRRRRGDRSGALCELLLASLVLHALFCLAANKSCFQFQRHSVGCIKIAVFGY